MMEACFSFADTTELTSVRTESFEYCMEPEVSGDTLARTSALTALSIATLAARSSEGPVAGAQAEICAWQCAVNMKRRTAA